KNSSPGCNDRQTGSDTTGPRHSINQRLADIYGQDTFALQSMYEKQVARETWLLKNEAIWLISGIEPVQCNEVDEETRNKITGLWEHARKCVEEGLLQVVNREQEADLWEVRPLDIYQWARVSRVELPEVFSNLMGFVAKSIKPVYTAADTESAHDAFDRKAYEFDQDREAVLGMALAVLAAFPDECRSSGGRIKADRIVSIITDKEKFWLGNRQTAMSSIAMRDLISKWLATVPASE
ncbi:MAG TPA: hypothetical protein VJ981_04845, partial [Gammaproteobacteria bacterium]|nr:hypothetical protein [Gammaproteobacteria bacterium]